MAIISTVQKRVTIASCLISETCISITLEDDKESTVNIENEVLILKSCVDGINQVITLNETDQNDDGSYSFCGLRAGEKYTLEASATDYETTNVSCEDAPGITTVGGDNTSYNVNMTRTGKKDQFY